MDLELVIQSEVSQKEKNKFVYNAYKWNLENITDEPICKVGMETQT